MEITATELRQNLYNIIDQVIQSGVPVEIKRKGRIVKLIAEKPQSIFESLKPHDIIVGNPNDLVHLDWSDTWKCEIN